MAKQSDEEARRQQEEERQRQAALEASRQRGERAQQQDKDALESAQRDDRAAQRTADASKTGPQSVNREGRAAAQREESGTPRVPGVYIRGGKVGPDGKHYGGEIVTHDEKQEGVKVLATFKPDQENTGNPEDGDTPEE